MQITFRSDPQPANAFSLRPRAAQLLLPPGFRAEPALDGFPQHASPLQTIAVRPFSPTSPPLVGPFKIPSKMQPSYTCPFGAD